MQAGKKFMRLVCMATTLLIPCISQAEFSSGSNEADGAFEPTANIAVQIPESGILNYTTVTIPSGVTVTFKKNAQNTPVTILAKGNVNIDGTVSVNGFSGNYIIPGAGGPGGFGGGQGGPAFQAGTRGEGPGGAGGGGPCVSNNAYAVSGGGGGFATAGNGVNNYGSCFPQYSVGGISYGNEKILPAIGGSGGGGGGGNNTWVGGAGGGGGGAIIIASSGIITVNGSISANGGYGATPSAGQSNFSAGGGGSGGSIRLIANTISGNGSITANGGGGGNASASSTGGNGSSGRIRLEASNILRTAATSPPMAIGYPYAVVPPNMPTLTITSIGGMTVSGVPSGAFGTPDVMLPFNTKNPITIVVTGTNIPSGTLVTLNANPSEGTITSTSGALAGTDTSNNVSLSLNISTAYPSIITASVTYTLTAANGAPIYAGGERVEKVRVASNLGGSSTVTYITADGREIPAVM
jgi:hypothetical protein